MKLNPLRYLGESIPRHGSALLGDPVKAWDAPATEIPVVQSSIETGRVFDSTLDLAAIEREARAAQSAWIAAALKSWFKALARKLSTPAPTPTQGGEMIAMTDSTVEWAYINKRLDEIRMSEYDRRHARESLRNAEIMVEFLTSTGGAIGSVVNGVEHAVLSMAHGIKAIFARPLKH